MEELESVEGAMEEYKKWGANALRAECRRLKTTPSSSNKASYLAALRASLLVEGTVTSTGVVQGPFKQATPDRKTVDCVFRLINVLFSDRFCEGVARLGDVATRQELDTHAIGNASSWWNEVCDAYNDDDDETFNALIHTRVDFSSIDPAAFRQHDTKKLWAMWKDLTRDYREIYGRFTKSGNNAPFSAFHGGKVDLYYLHLLTTVTKPNLHACIIQTLPDEIMTDSFELGTRTGTKSAKSIAAKPGSRADEVVDVLKGLAHNEDKTLLMKRQIVFFEESITLKRQKDARCEKEHEAVIRAAKLREKKDSVELLVTLQKNLREMRRELSVLLREGCQSNDCEVVDLQGCIAKLKREMDLSLR